MLRREDRQVHPLLTCAAAALAAAVVGPGALVAARPSDAHVLAAHLKASMQTTYRKIVPGLVFRTVTCRLPQRATKGRCTAAFVIPARRLKGAFTVQATVDRKTGGVHWRATSASCTDTRTRKRVSC